MLQKNDSHERDVLLPPVSCHVFIFYNPRSGNCQGQQVKDYAEQFVRLKRDTSYQVSMFDLTDVNDRVYGVEYLCALIARDPENKVKFVICSAGGDGSFVWVLSNLLANRVDIKRSNLYFTVFGFGTGNDLSQTLGWGRYIPYRDTATFDGFSKHIIYRLQGNISRMDLWKVSVVPNRGTVVDRENGRTSIPHGYTEKATRFQRTKNTGILSCYMSNYLTLGVQGVVGTGFEQHRRGSRLLNVLEYAKQCLRNGVLNHMERVSEYVSHIEHDGINYELDPNKKQCRRMVEIIFQNLPGIWGRQHKLWDLCKAGSSVALPPTGGADREQWTKSALSDGKLDVYGIRSRLDYLFKQMEGYCKRSTICRVGQFSDEIVIHCVPGSLFHMMLDGEFYVMYNIKEIRLNKATDISILTNY